MKKLTRKTERPRCIAVKIYWYRHASPTYINIYRLGSAALLARFKLARCGSWLQLTTASNLHNQHSALCSVASTWKKKPKMAANQVGGVYFRSTEAPRYQDCP